MQRCRKGIRNRRETEIERKTSFLLSEKRHRNLPLHLRLCCKEDQLWLMESCLMKWECERHECFLVPKLAGAPRFRISAMPSSSKLNPSLLFSHCHYTIQSLAFHFINPNYHDVTSPFLPK